jgi:uncharacterized protein (DUF1015 family)
MITIKPFKAIRPTRDKAYLVATRSYVSYTHEELEEKLNNNPYTFLHVINPDYHDKKHSHGQERYQKVKTRFEQFRHLEYFIEEEKPAYYIYQQQAQNHVFTGIIAATSVQDYLDGKIKVHENTLSAREEMFTNYLNATGFNAEPVLLMYRPQAALGELKKRYINTRAEYEFTSTDKALHLLWPVTNDADVALITKTFAEVDALYIADGHHRCASSVHLAALRQGPPDAAHNYFMAMLLPETTIRIHEFNRLVKDLNGLTTDEFLAAIKQNFFVRELEVALHRPFSLHEMSLYVDGKWYSLFYKPGIFNPEDAVAGLDCQILSSSLLDPILGIKDLRTDSRIEFLPGNTGPEGIKKAVDSGKFKAGFGLYPVSIEQLKRVSDEGLVMPPKSTYIEPKLRSGLIIYNLDEA